MLIWILALIVLASAAALGYRQGAIRVAFSFVGIVFACLLAAPIGKLLKPLLSVAGIHNETLQWMIAPIEGFVLVLILFKVAGYFVHHKVEMYYKYKAGDLKLALWERMHQRVGACLGIMNGAAYFVLICFVVFNFSYWTVQIAPSDAESRTTRLVNSLGHDLQSTGMNKAAKAVADLPDNYYKAADLAGLICQNPGVAERLANYPAFISLTERDEIQQLAQDSTFTNAWAQHAPMGQLLNEPQLQNILKNNDLINVVWTLVSTNMDDLTAYLKTGKSEKYDSEKILGRWDFNIGVSLAMYRQGHPNMPAREYAALRALWHQAYTQMTFIAGTDNQCFLKSLPNFAKSQVGQPVPAENLKGEWTAGLNNYEVTLADGEKRSMIGTSDGMRLTLKDDRNVFVFDKEE